MISRVWCMAPYRSCGEVGVSSLTRLTAPSYTASELKYTMCAQPVFAIAAHVFCIMARFFISVGISRPLSGVSAASMTTASVALSAAASSSAAAASARFRSAEDSASLGMRWASSSLRIAAPMKPRAPSRTTRSGFCAAGLW